MTTTRTDQASRHPVFARLWAPISRQLDKQGAAQHRCELVGGLEGRVIEIGAGNGRNFAHYPPTVSEVVAVEPEPYLRGLAEQAAQTAPVDVQVTDGTAEQLPQPAGAFDAGVVSLVLCSVADLPAALGEIRRVLRPQGRLRFFEHVIADHTVARKAQRALDATVWPRLGGGCHAARDTVTEIERAGFRIEYVDRFRFPDTKLPLPTSPHVLGDAAAGSR